jgi:GTP-binding protein YchF
MDVAIVGKSFSGKTTVFRALTAGHGQPDQTRGEHIGAVKIPDERLQRLAELLKPRKVTPVEVLLHDLPALFQRGAAASREASESLARSDALIHVVRAFERDDVPHPDGSVDPARDIADLDSELMLSDLATIERRLERLDTQVRSARPGEREAGEKEQALLRRCRQLLEAGKPLRSELTDAGDLRAAANFGFLSLKPMLLLLNIGEQDAPRGAQIAGEQRRRYQSPRTAAEAMCARLEAELAELDEEDAGAFRSELGVEEAAAQRVLTRVIELLGLLTFFTVNEREARAWTLPRGATALQAAGRVHTDMERGFIRAEVISWQKLLERGSQAEARKHGELRTEGKGYVVQDGDVVNILFNV